MLTFIILGSIPIIFLKMPIRPVKPSTSRHPHLHTNVREGHHIRSYKAIRTYISGDTYVCSRRDKRS